MKTNYFKAFFLMTITLSFVSSLAQSYDPSGPSNNLCPNTTYRYTSPVAINGGSCDQSGGWICNGCVDESVQGHGTNSDGTVWADVKWSNVSTGSIGNFCGGLNVTINSIAQPSITGPGTVLLCGTNSVVLNATVPTSTNIVGYTWVISGTGISPTGTINTTNPQITLNYTNWTAGSALSATVVVASRNSCDFKTPTSPLTDIPPVNGVPNSGIPAIPRTAWVQLSPGNIDDLTAPLSISPSVICSTATMTISNQPAGSSLTWSSGNSSALTVNSSTGAAIRVNNFTGSVPVSATLANNCGSSTHSINVWLGVPPAPGTLLQSISPLCIGDEKIANIAQLNGASSVNWVSNNANLDLGTPCGSTSCAEGFSTIVQGYATGNYSFKITSSNICGSQSHTYFVGVTDCGGGAFALDNFSIYPNPSNNTITVENLETSGQPSSVVIKSSVDGFRVELIDKSGILKKSAFSENNKLVLNVSELQRGTYFLRVIRNTEISTHQILIE